MTVQHITFTVSGAPGSQVATAPVIDGPVPNGSYIVEVGIQPTFNNMYVAVVTPVGVAEQQAFQSGDL